MYCESVIITKTDFLHDEHSTDEACRKRGLVFKTVVFIFQDVSSEYDVIIKTVSPLRRVVRISTQRRISRRILHYDELWDTKMLEMRTT
ncbi:unnamed protein product [Larinioides sclopetarius]|uniref:Uncharacterized protein n=1 Tax=Larinioides sclopetarius TaxID=280406 RepID=A0AAV2AT31_9ARAC